MPKRKTTRRYVNPNKEINNNNLVVNLSNHHLTPDEISILNKGLSFVPTPPPTPIAENLRDLYLFNRRLKLSYFFKDHENTYTTNPFKPSTGWTPHIDREPALETYFKLLENATTGHRNKKTRPNISRDESTAIRNLNNNKDIIIKPADKGGAIVLLNKEDYLREAYRQLSDSLTYKELNKDPTNKTNAEIIKLISQWDKRNLLDSDTVKGLKNRQPKTATLYLLPKIHKNNTPGRPIISAINSPTEKISAFVDHHIKPLAQIQPSYLRDTKDFLNKLKSLTVNENTYIITADVSSLYTNIPHNEGIQANKKFLNTRSNNTTCTNVIIHMMHLILTKNNFQFYGKNYLQINGTAMGTKMAPNYANLFMADLEDRLLKEAPNNLTPTVWWRYIDDIFFTWDHSEEQLQTFMDHMNNFHHSIKFTHDVSKDKGVFLDTEIFKVHDQLCTKVYHKPTDAYAYLHYSSCHPNHVKNNIPFGQFSRIRRICTYIEDFKSQSSTLKRKLLARGYPFKLINQAYQKALLLNRDDLLKDKEPSEPKHNIILTTTFNPPNNHLPWSIKKYKFTLETSTHKDFYNNLNFIQAYKKGPSLRNKLVSSTLTPHITLKPKGSHPCHKPCATCPLMQPAYSVHSTVSNYQHKIRGSYNCQSKNVIYLITCNKCHIQYVGQTTNTLNTRMRNHISDITTRKCDKSIANHYNNVCNVTNVTCTVIDSQSSHDVNTLLRLEEAYIRLLVTTNPSGLNDQQ